MDDRREYLVAQNTALTVDTHLAGHGQAVFPCVQAANTVRKPFGQHGQHPVYQVDAGATFPGLFIEDSVFFHIIADISDVYAQQKFIVIQLFYINSIVQILGVVAVHRYDGQLA